MGGSITRKRVGPERPERPSHHDDPGTSGFRRARRTVEMEPIRTSNAQLADLLPEPILEIDMGGRISFANRAALSTFGLSHEDLAAGLSPLELVVPEQRERAAADMSSLLLGNKIEGAEFKVMHTSGSTFFVSVYAGPIFKDGAITGAGGIALDITGRKEAEMRFEEIRERYEALFSRSQEAVFILDFHGNVKDANRMAQKLLGFSGDELNCMNFAALITQSDLDEAVGSLREMKRTGRPTDLKRFRFRTKAGAELLMSVSGSLVIKDGMPDGMMCLARDVTELYRLREDLEAVRARNLSGRTISEGAHEFKRELQSIKLAFQFVKRAVEKGNQDAALERIEKAMLELEGTERLLKSMMQVGISEMVDVREFALTRVLGNVVIHLSPIATSSGVHLDLDFDRSILLKGDPDQLEMAIKNIAINAVESMPGGGTLGIKSSCTEREVVITVSDTGSGMSAETKARIFDPFFTTKGEKGNGLGLAITWRMVQNCGGKIKVMSEPGSGTVFEITIPR